MNISTTVVRSIVELIDDELMHGTVPWFSAAGGTFNVMAGIVARAFGWSYDATWTAMEQQFEKVRGTMWYEIYASMHEGDFSVIPWEEYPNPDGEYDDPDEFGFEDWFYHTHICGWRYLGTLDGLTLELFGIENVVEEALLRCEYF